MTKVISPVAWAAAAALCAAAAPAAGEVKFGFLGGFTGPIESLTPPIFEGAKLAASQVNAGGGLTGGEMTLVEGDTGCGDTALASSAADRLVNSEGVVGIVGALCSGATIAAANAAGVPGGVVMISPASTSPALSELDDDDLVFRTAPSDAAQGPALAKLLRDKGVQSVAISYVNNDYGKLLAGAVAGRFADLGGEVAIEQAHEDNKADYRAELGALEASGADTLLVVAYADSSGQTILRQAVESGVFASFAGADGMVADSLLEAVGADALAEMIASKPTSPALAGAEVFAAAAEAVDLDPNAVFAAQSYDAAFLLALAYEAQAAGDLPSLSTALREVASAPGEVILPGEWAKAKELLAAGQDINYEGASGGHEFDEVGDVAGVFAEMAVDDGSFVVVGPIE